MNKIPEHELDAAIKHLIDPPYISGKLVTKFKQRCPKHQWVDAIVKINRELLLEPGSVNPAFLDLVPVSVCMVCYKIKNRWQDE